MAASNQAIASPDLPEFAGSSQAKDDRFLLDCERAGHEPARVFDALMKSMAYRYPGGPSREETSERLTEEDRRILIAYTDALFLPTAAARAVLTGGQVELPGGADPVDHCLALLRSARRKAAILRQDEMTPVEEVAHEAYMEWVRAAATDDLKEELEAQWRTLMPSVMVLDEAGFDEAFQDIPEPTLVYFHKPEPRAFLRMERLARHFAPYGRVARVDVMRNYGLAERFRIILNREPLLMFDLNGSLRRVMSGDDTFESIVATFEPLVASMRSKMSDPERAARLAENRAYMRRVREEAATKGG